MVRNVLLQNSEDFMVLTADIQVRNEGSPFVKKFLPLAVSSSKECPVPTRAPSNFAKTQIWNAYKLWDLRM
jgi:hypothetical protein